MRRTWTLIAVSLATFMTYLDNNIVNVAIPAIQRDLNLTTAGLEWVVSAYILVFASLLLASGRLADLYGRRRLFTLGLTIFTGASFAAGLAGSDSALIAARAVQGLGAALVTPTTLAIISATFPDSRERTRAVGLWSAVGALGLALGPLLGGLLSQHLSWSWIFFVNVPVGLVTIVLGGWAIEPDAAADKSRTIDLPGLVLSALGLFALTYALIEGHDRGWTSAPITLAFAVALVALVTFTLVERRSNDPMVDVRLFANRVFSGGIVAIVMWGFGLFGIYFFTSIYLQDVLGFSATEAGAAFVPMALLMVIGSIAAERVAAIMGAHRSVGLAMLLMAAGMASLTVLGRDSSFLALMPSFALVGVGGGLSVPLTAMILGAMPQAQAGVASGIFNASREVAGLLGITVIGAILAARQSAVARAGHAPLDAYLSGYRLGLIVAAVLVAAGGVAAFLALRQGGQQLPPAEDIEPELVLAS
ncbi:MAG TPA: MFS transporter [Jatrophihabitantaceae bacterium]|nr:MFS transporter [Jatrophihabitantaceae bacterium]